MSNLPLKPSNLYNDKRYRGNEFVSLTRKFLLLPDSKSQLTFILETFAQEFSCKLSIWLSETFSKEFNLSQPECNELGLVDFSGIVAEAYQRRAVYPKPGLDTRSGVPPTLIALPLMINEEVLAVLRLERGDQEGFTTEEVNFISEVGLHAAVLLDWQRQKYLTSEKQNKFQFLNQIFNINKSISSILDLDNLLNGVISLIHQSFNYHRVSIFTPYDIGRKKLNRVSVSKNGFDIAKTDYFTTDDLPIGWVISHGEPLLIKGTGSDERFPQAVYDPLTQSELIIPLASAGQLLGVMDICSDRVDAFGEIEVSAFQTLGETVAVAIRNSKIIQAENSRQQVSDNLSAIITNISADTSPDDIYFMVLHDIERNIECDAAGFWLTDSLIANQEAELPDFPLRIVAFNITDDRMISSPLPENQSLDVYQKFTVEDDSEWNTRYSFISELQNSDLPIIRNTFSAYEPIGNALNFTGEYSALGIPLFFNDHFFGIVILVHHEMDFYDEESYLFASTYASVVPGILKNAMLFTSAHEQVWLSTALSQVAESIQAMTTQPDLLTTCASLLTNLAGVNASAIFLYEQSANTFHPQYASGFSEDQRKLLNDWDVISGTIPAFELLVERKSPVIVTRETLTDEIITGILKDYDLQANLLILFPLIAHENMIGAALIDFTGSKLGYDSPQKIWDEMYAIIQGITQQSAYAVDNLQKIKSREEEAYISVALLQVAQAIVSLNQLDEILSTIVRVTPILVGVRRCVIYLWDEENNVFHQDNHFGFTKNELKFEDKHIRLSDFPLLEAIFQQNAIHYYQLTINASPTEWSDIQLSDIHIINRNQLDDVQVSIKLDSAILREKSRLLIGLPLSVTGEVLGVMLIEEEDPIRGSTSPHIREKRIEIIKGITQQAALAIKNDLLLKDALRSEKIEREFQLAREIQQAFLPDSIPYIPGWDIDVRWQPARQVGGDFYDLLFLDDTHLGIVIADVADKGMPAALFMTLIRTLIRSAAKEINSPAGVLKQVNELLLQDAKNGMFVTVFYGVFDIKSGSVIYANAGHNPPIRKTNQSNQLNELTRTSMALGVFYDIEIDEREILLQKDELLLLYTDGITEAFSETEEMFGTQRLYNLLDKRYQSSKQVLDVIESAVNTFIGRSDLSDDLTLLAIYRKQ